MLFFAPPQPTEMTLEIHAAKVEQMEFQFSGDEKPTRKGSFLVTVHAANGPKERDTGLSRQIAIAWGEAGRVPKPYAGATYVKTVKLPAGTNGPLIAYVFWLPGAWGRTRFDRMDSLGLDALTEPFVPARRVRVAAHFEVSMALPGA